MKSLHISILESLLDDEEEVINRISTKTIKDGIKQFLKDNYGSPSNFKISNKPNADGLYEVSCKSRYVSVRKDAKASITAPTNGLFKFENFDGYMDFSYCHKLTTLEGCPEKIKEFSIRNCISLTTLEGCPKEVSEDFWCGDCTSLKSLKGAPEIVGGSFRCERCTSLKTLEGGPKKVANIFSCHSCDSLRTLEGIKDVKSLLCGYCKSLISLKGAPNNLYNFDCPGCISLTSLEYAPKKVDGCFDCNGCSSLTSLEYAPKKVDGSFSCKGCKVSFTKEDVLSVSDVGGTIHVDKH